MVHEKLRQKKTLACPVTVHIRRVADFRSSSPSTSTSLPSTDGDIGPGGDPNRSYGFRSGQGPGLQGFPSSRGIPNITPASIWPVYGTSTMVAAGQGVRKREKKLWPYPWVAAT